MRKREEPPRAAQFVHIGSWPQPVDATAASRNCAGVVHPIVPASSRRGELEPCDHEWHERARTCTNGTNGRDGPTATGSSFGVTDAASWLPNRRSNIRRHCFRPRCSIRITIQFVHIRSLRARRVEHHLARVVRRNAPPPTMMAARKEARAAHLENGSGYICPCYASSCLLNSVTPPR